METTSIDSLMKCLLEATHRLEQAVMQTDSDPEEWIAILDEREKLIGLMKEKSIAETDLTEEQRQQLSEVSEINRKLIPHIFDRKQGVQKQLNNVQRSKLAMNKYHDMGPSGYGAFFDRKK